MSVRLRVCVVFTYTKCIGHSKALCMNTVLLSTLSIVKWGRCVRFSSSVKVYD